MTAQPKLSRMKPMNITTKGLITFWIFSLASGRFSGTFFDDFSNSAKSKETWDVIHRNVC